MSKNIHEYSIIRNITTSKLFEEILNYTNSFIMDNPNVSTYNVSVNGTLITETLEQLNARYAAALLPFTIILGCFGVIGIIGNILVFIVYGCGKKFKDQKFRYYVLTLAFIDFITCLTLIPAEMVKHISYFNFTERALCKTKCFFNVFAASSASYCLTLIAADRYIMTCHPLFFAKLQKYSFSFASRLCILMLFLAVVTSIPAAILCGITESTMTDFNGYDIKVFLCETEPFYENNPSRYIYRTALCAAQTSISIIMIILYARIGHAVMTVMKIRECKHGTIQLNDLKPKLNRGEHSSSMKPGCHVCSPNIPSKIKLLFVVTVVFIVTYAFYMCLSWIDQTRLSPTQFFFFSVSFRLYFIHSIINPFLYTKMDRYFRNRCFKLVRTIFRC
ncbi:olfactory receptor 8B12-like [Mercenaria mercenaria]|uniref:olfactory receptor 8B12-like n=1 Tax=Mercenaria mercenaria TaxID=6596 RepID=UPI00234F9C85|nr:olfactory receptor 8B12-like [Mercenaria mercenaria]XP_045189603.2 olfactory receptor 8B12-like [Mercenaria mercenaria]XP_053407201.1 olfactory receptor 8B12-like [Mercenaria mercenaria]